MGTSHPGSRMIRHAGSRIEITDSGSAIRLRDDSMTNDADTPDAPKSALDLVLERLRRKDAEAGVEETLLTDAQRAAIAEARSVYEARVAERRIMHRSSMLTAIDPAERETLEEALRRDLERFESDRERKVRQIRGGG